MEKVCVVRHRVLVEGQSIRRVARELGISRLTAKRYVGGAEVGRRREAQRGSPVSGKVVPRLEALLEESRGWTQGKQRLTSARAHELLRAEGLEISARRLRELMAEYKRKRQEVYVPLVYGPGELGEVDFFEVWVDLGAERVKAWMFVMRLMYSGRDFAWLYPRQDQVCFFDGHVRAFGHFGGVPHRVVYDNLKAAVVKVLVGSERELNERFVALTNHYLYEASFARPRTGHDKGGVESRGRAVRWQHLVPIPRGASLAEMSEALLARLDERMGQDRNAAGETIAQRFATEKGRLLPLFETRYVASEVMYPEVSRRALVQLKGSSYSVWSEWAGLSVTAYVGVEQIELVGPDGRRVEHARVAKGQRSVRYRHYLGELGKKPQAVRQVVAELLRELGTPYGELWRELVDEHGVKQAARIFARVLRAMDEQGETTVSERVQVALCSGEPVLLALRVAPPSETELGQSELPESLRSVQVYAGRAADYDELLCAGEA